ncbi:MAG: hypothetical protein HY872_12715 [Chloroflexi bacterium]|nr:hypothetical protein [Chloroflexota bacterium]
MLKVQGVYDGTSVILLEPVTWSPDTKVEVLIPDTPGDAEQAYWRRIVELGLLKEFRPRPVSPGTFTPVQIGGLPLSQTILDERR